MKNTAICGAFAISAFASVSAQAITTGQKGQAGWLPLYGPMEDKICEDKVLGNAKPGAWVAGLQADRNIVIARGNDCRSVHVRLNPQTLHPIELVSPTDDGVDKPIPGSIPAPLEWWKLPHMQVRQAAPQLVNPYDLGKNGFNCRIKLGSGRDVVLRPGVMLVPDNYSAYFVGVDFDKSIRSEKLSSGVAVDYGKDGKSYCTLELVVKVLNAPSQAVVMRGGGLRNPVGIFTERPIQPAAAIVVPVAEVSAPYLIGAFNFLARNWAKGRLAYIVGDAVAYVRGVDILVSNSKIIKLTPEQIGNLIKNADVAAPPTQEEAEAGIKEAAQPVTSGAERLTKEHEESLRAKLGGTGGNCTPDRLRELEAQKRELCYNWSDGPDNENRYRIGGSMTCGEEIALSAFQIMVRAKMNAACARIRDQIRKECFDGGDINHRSESKKSWGHVLTCLNRNELR